MQSIAPEIESDVHGFLTVPASVKRRAAIGGTAPKRVRAELRRGAKKLGAS